MKEMRAQPWEMEAGTAVMVEVGAAELGLDVGVCHEGDLQVREGRGDGLEV